jgi:hypothetical protein
MSKKISLFFVLLSQFVLNAQIFDNATVQIEFNGNLGNYFGAGSNISYIDDNDLVFEFGYSYNVHHARYNVPENNHNLDLLTGFVSIFDRFDSFQNYHLLVGKQYFLNDSATISAYLIAGIGYAKYREPYYWTSTPKYIVKANTWDSMSFVIKPKIQFNFGRLISSSISPMIVFGNKRTMYLISIGNALNF